MAGKSDLRGRRVLLIEDEYMISMLVQDMLTDLGCEIVGVASRFDDAFEKAESLSFDVAILDINLNGRRTFAIAHALAARGAAFVLATGYGLGGLPEALQKVSFLQKPFQRKDLERALRAALIGV